MKRVERRERVRLERMLEADKGELTEECKRLARQDFLRVANEYFEVDGEVVLEEVHGQEGTDVYFRFRAVRVKNFTSIRF